MEQAVYPSIFFPISSLYTPTIFCFHFVQSIDSALFSLYFSNCSKHAPIIILVLPKLRVSSLPFDIHSDLSIVFIVTMALNNFIRVSWYSCSLWFMIWLICSSTSSLQACENLIPIAIYHLCIIIFVYYILKEESSLKF